METIYSQRKRLLIL